MKLLEIFFVAVNVIFWAIGGTMLGLGIWLAVDPNAFDALNIVGSAGMNDALYSTAVYMMIGIGAGVFLIGFLGCCGAMSNDDCTGKNVALKIYFVLVKLILIAEITSIVLVAIFWGSINDTIRDEMYNDVRYQYRGENETDGYSNSWNKMQIRWKCCGSNNYDDYKESNFYWTTSLPVPWSCCKMTYKGNTIYDVVNVAECRREGSQRYEWYNRYEFLYPYGCYEAFRNYLDRNAAIIIGVTCGFIGLQLVGSIIACLMMRGCWT